MATETNRSIILRFRVTEEEAAAIRARADEIGLSEYIRKALLGPEIEVEALDPTDVPQFHPGDDLGLVKWKSVPTPAPPESRDSRPKPQRDKATFEQRVKELRRTMPASNARRPRFPLSE